MLVNNKNIDIFKCRCIKFTPNSSTYKNNSIVYTCNNINPFKGMNVEELRTVETIFIFYGSNENIQKNISRFIEEIKYSIVNIGSFYYEINIKTTSEPTVLTNNSCKLNLTFDLFNMYESEKSITINTSKTITINSPKPCYANLEILANTNVTEAVISINDTDITVNNIKGNEKIYIGSGKVLAGGKSKIEDVDIWEFPILRPGSNTIKVNREDVNVTVKYNERW